MKVKVNWIGSIIFFLYIFLWVFSACQSKTVKLDENQFKCLLLEIHKVDAALNVSSDLRSRGQKKNYAYYNALFDKYGITNAEFDSCMHYYSGEMEVFDKMYDYIIDSLNKELTIKDTILMRLQKDDSVDYYHGVDTINLLKVEKNLLISEDSLRKGEYHFSTKAKLDTISTSKNIYIESYFLTSSDDTLKVRKIRLIQDTLVHTYQWKQYVDSTFSRLKIYLITENVRYNTRDKNRKVKKDYIEGKLYEIDLFRPFLPQNTETRLMRGLVSQSVYKRK